MSGTGKRILTHSAPKDKKTRRRRRLTWKERLIVLLPATAALIALAVIYIAGRDLASVTLVGSPVQYYGGASFSIQSGAKVRRTAEGRTMLVTESGERELDVLPIYFADRKAVLLPQDMVSCSPLKHQYECVACLSELSLDGYGTVTARRGNAEAKLGSSFLYDGKDFYLFLEPVVVQFNNYRFDLPAFSFVEAAFSGDVMVFDYEEKSFFFEKPRGEAIATIPSTGTEISLLGDSMTDTNGERSLLFTKADLLESVY